MVVAVGVIVMVGGLVVGVVVLPWDGKMTVLDGKATDAIPCTPLTFVPVTVPVSLVVDACSDTVVVVVVDGCDADVCCRISILVVSPTPLLVGVGVVVEEEEGF